MNLPGILRKPSDVMACAQPGRIIETLPVGERLVEIEILQWVQLWDACSGHGNKRGSICGRYSQGDRVKGAGLELVFTGEPEIVSEIVADRAIRPSELKAMIAVEPGQSVFELRTILIDDVGGAEGAAKPSQTSD